MQNDQSATPSNVYDLVHMLRKRISSHSQRRGYDGVEETVGMCETRPNNKKDIAYKISQRAIASIPTASVSNTNNEKYDMVLNLHHLFDIIIF